MMKLIESPDSVAPGNVVIPTELILRETCVGAGQPPLGTLSRVGTTLP
jgi:hypothetical protein